MLIVKICMLCSIPQDRGHEVVTMDFLNLLLKGIASADHL
jgi:hypothetical protein